MCKKIKERIATGNKCYFSINKLLRLKLLSKKSKITFYTRYLKPIITLQMRLDPQKKKNNRKFAICEIKMLRIIIYERKYNDELSICEKRYNEELYMIYV